MTYSTEPDQTALGFTLRQLEYFRAVASAGSFSAAADQLFVSQSALATAVTDLERSLDTVLLIRKKSRGIVVTPAGQQFLAESRTFLRAAHELRLSVANQPGQLRGPLTVGCFSTIAATVLPPLLAGFSELHPDVSLAFVDGDMPELLPLLANGSIDVLLTYRIALPPELTEVVLYETSGHIILPADHRLAGQDTVSVKDLADEPLILCDLVPSASHALDMLYDAGVQPRVVRRTRNFELVRSLVARHLGYAIMIQRPDIDISYEGLPLVTKPIKETMPREHVVALWPADVTLTHRAQAFVDYAQTTVRHPPTASAG